MNMKEMNINELELVNGGTAIPATIEECVPFIKDIKPILPPTPLGKYEPKPVAPERPIGIPRSLNLIKGPIVC